MKNLSLLVWLTQLGLSVALPLGGFVLLAVWLRQRFNWGVWVIVAGVLLGVICAVDGLIPMQINGRCPRVPKIYRYSE